MTIHEKDVATDEQAIANALAETLADLDDRLTTIGGDNGEDPAALRDALDPMLASLREQADTDEDRAVLATLESVRGCLARLADFREHESTYRLKGTANGLDSHGILASARDLLRSLADDLVDTAEDKGGWEERATDAEERANEHEDAAGLAEDLDAQGWDEPRLRDALRERGFLYAGETVADGIVRWLEDRPAVNLRRPEWSLPVAVSERRPLRQGEAGSRDARRGVRS